MPRLFRSGSTAGKAFGIGVSLPRQDYFFEQGCLHVINRLLLSGQAREFSARWVIAGAFTFVPGRIMNAVAFGP